MHELSLHAEFQEVPDSQFLQPAEVPLDGGKLSGISATLPSFMLLGKLVEGTLCLVIQIINEDIKQDQILY